MRSKIILGIYDKDFCSARLVTYGVIYAVLIIAVSVPIHYTCSSMGGCIGCGFREAITCALHFDFFGAVSKNQLIVPFLLFCVFSVLDSSGIILRSKKHKQLRK